ncbi:hemoglobin subunit alpha-5-like isoform X2 [Hyperolius riggenbachi]|uniref:hemoglobin subunit alpha-5-like isoform X2 n=1 Tax=Hyperolius riggenbachi TaxID=752182 RepID=UPI0035A32B72
MHYLGCRKSGGGSAAHKFASGIKSQPALLMTCFPQTKTYFSHFDLSHGSTDLRRHGGKVFNAIGNAVHHLNDLHHALSHLSDLHTQNLKVDSGSFKLLSYAIQVTLASRFPKDFTPAAHTAWDKFLYVVSTIIVQNTSNPDTH